MAGSTVTNPSSLTGVGVGGGATRGGGGATAAPGCAGRSVTNPVGSASGVAAAGWLGGVSAVMLSNCAGVSGFGVSSSGSRSSSRASRRQRGPSTPMTISSNASQASVGARRSGRSGFFASIRSSHAQSRGVERRVERLAAAAAGR